MIDPSHPAMKWVGASVSGAATYVGTEVAAAAADVPQWAHFVQFYCGIFVTVGGAISTVIFIGCLILDFRRKLRNDLNSGRLDSEEGDTAAPSRIE